jgi:hypothetical protein
VLFGLRIVGGVLAFGLAGSDGSFFALFIGSGIVFGASAVGGAIGSVVDPAPVVTLYEAPVERYLEHAPRSD